MKRQVKHVIIAITNIKGGVGKTTSAIALGCAAAAAGHDVRVYDADPQGSSTEWALTAEEVGEPLPFEVVSANVAGVRRISNDKRWSIIDCPPSGTVTDVAATKADLVIVPTSPAPVDLARTWETADALASQGIAYAILVTKTQPNTITYRSAMAELAETGMSSFDVTIPKREAIVSAFGHPFDELFGYDKVLNEIEEAVDGD